MNTHLVKVKSVKRIGRIEKTYNIQVAKNRNYFCKGVLLHNCVDDPNNVLDSAAVSEKELQNVIDWWDLVMPTRLNDPKKGTYIIIMQRCHPKDLTGHILATSTDSVHVCLPAEYDGKHKYKWAADPRSIAGELLCPERFGRKEITELKKKLGTFGASGQLQQLPVPREGGMYKSSWFKIASVLPVEPRRVIRFWDRASTEKKKANDPDWTAGTRISRTRDGMVHIENIAAFRGTPRENERRMTQRAALDTMSVQIFVEEEGGSSGKDSIDHYQRNVLSGYAVRGRRSTGPKESYIDVLAAQAEAGNVTLYRLSEADDEWIDLFLSQWGAFPIGTHDDLIDSAAKGYAEINVNAVNIRDLSERDEQAAEKQTDMVVASHTIVPPAGSIIGETQEAPLVRVRDPDDYDEPQRGLGGATSYQGRFSE